MRKIIILPGIGGSGDGHWQTHWEASSKNFARFAPSSWDEPHLEDWISALDTAVAATDAPPVLVAHSLACLLVAHWQARSSAPIAGAMLVAVPDPHGAAFPAEAASFADPPAQRFRFASLVVASGNDPYGAIDHARQRAGQWGSKLIEAGPVGHINAGSGLGNWPAGRAVLDEFVTSLPVT